MGKPMKAADLAGTLANHYPGVEFNVSFDETKGSTCKVMINKKQAVAGQNFKNKPQAQLSKDACNDIAEEAHKIAAAKYNSDYPEKTVPKKISGGGIYGS